jgi:crossover junction endodeoxyribonuclease RusA
MTSSSKLTTGSVLLPWPPKELSPNARVNWRKLRGPQSPGERYKQTAWALCKEARLTVAPGDGWISLFITFSPPDRRRRDIDNMLASLKSGLDGIALALGVDDQRFGTITMTRGEPVKHGKIVVAIG